MTETVTSINFSRKEIFDFITGGGTRQTNKQIEAALGGELTLKESIKLGKVDDACDYTLEAIKEVLGDRSINN